MKKQKIFLKNPKNMKKQKTILKRNTKNYEKNI